MENANRNSFRLLILLSAVAALSVLAYLPSFSGPFIYDDIRQILANRALQGREGFIDIIFNGIRQIRVWQNLSFALNWFISSDNGWSYRAFNLALHIANACFIYVFLSRALPGRRFLAWFTAAIFLVHPLQFHSVGYIMGRISLLQMFFTMLTLVLHQQGSRPAIVATTVVAGILAKESCVLNPLLLVAYELTIGGRTIKNLFSDSDGAVSENGRRLIWALSAMLFFVPAYFLLKDPRNIHEGTAGFDLFPYWDYIVVQLSNYVFYAELLFSPWRMSLVHPYEHPNSETYVRAAIGTLALLSACWYAFRYRRSSPLFSFLFIFFIFSIAPTNSIVQMKNPFAEYRLYQPNFAVFTGLAAIGLAVWNYLKTRQTREVAAFRFTGGLICATCIVGCAAYTHGYAQIWKDRITIYKWGVGLYPESSEMQTHVGVEHERLDQLDEAASHYEIAARLLEKDALPTVRPIFRLAKIRFRQGKFEEAEKTINLINEDSFRFGTPPELLEFKKQLREQLKEKDAHGT